MVRSYLLLLQSKLLILVEQVSYPCRASLLSLQSKSLILAEQASHPCRTSFLKTWWASLGLYPVGGPRKRMDSTFFGLVDMGLLGSPMGPLGLPSLISHFTLFSCNVMILILILVFGVIKPVESAINTECYIIRKKK